MSLLINGIILIIVGITHWKIVQLTKVIDAQLQSLSKRHSKFMNHLTRELKIPMPEFEDLKIIKKNTPRVIKKTENDEYERELPIEMSGKKTI